MIEIVLLIVAGGALGYALRRRHWLRRIERSISWTVYVMLFVLGLTVGANPLLLRQWAGIGGQALLLSVAGVAGTLATVCLLGRFIRNREKRR